MKRNALFCLCLCLCVLFSACVTPVPEDSSAPSEETGEPNPVPKDENAKIVRAYLDELLEREWNAEAETVEWIAPDRVETIRESVKNLKTPILTAEDVLRIAGQAVIMEVFLLRDDTRTLELPSCGVMGEISWVSYAYYEEFYRALLGYTLYLFTPPEYVFREDEVGNQLGFPAEASLYFPLKGDYTTRREALALLQEGKNGVELPLYGFGPEEHPLNFNFCGVPFLLLKGWDSYVAMRLHDMAENMKADEELFEYIGTQYAEAYVQSRIAYYSNPGISHEWVVSDSYHYNGNSWFTVNMLLTPEKTQEIREMVELLSVPVLTEETVSALAYNMFLRTAGLDGPLLLPGIDGREDTLLWPAETDPVTMAHRATAFFIELFTPSAYRFEPLLGFGIGYALRGTEAIYSTPEEAMEVFSAGLVRFAWIDNGDPYFIDRDGNLEPPAEDPLYVTPY